jgi:hypothetical protein
MVGGGIGVTRGSIGGVSGRSTFGKMIGGIVGGAFLLHWIGSAYIIAVFQRNGITFQFSRWKGIFQGEHDAYF